MEPDRLKRVLRQWLPGEEPMIIEEIHSGISSHARKIMCGETQGIFREIASEAHAKTEAEFAAVLAPQGIAPALRLTKHTLLMCRIRDGSLIFRNICSLRRTDHGAWSWPRIWERPLR